MKIAVYVSSHGIFRAYTLGFGHSSRVSVVIQELISRGHTVHLMTNAPNFLFKDSIESPKLKISSSKILDPPIIQKNAYVASSLKAIQDFLANLKLDVDAESQWLKMECFDLVYIDSPPAPVLAAKMVDIPAILVTNFTFDSIYDGFCTSCTNDGETRLIKSVSKEFMNMYSNASCLIRLPGYIDIPCTNLNPDMKRIDVPLVVRRAKTRKHITREKLSIPLNSQCLLVTLGGFDIQDSNFEDWITDRLPNGWYCLVTTKEFKHNDTEKIKFLNSNDWFTPDIIEASDVVLGKLGYGTCSEMVAHNKPFVFIARDLFCEQDGLLSNLMTPYGRCIEMTHYDFDKGNWAPYLVRALHLPPAHQQISSDGHQIISNILESICRNSKY